ncbi:FecR family protein [Mucilaginibacter sp. FT3.2]|uniref:FecR family protein n=1 Tax=Mucilaginibacter sp. FT3.2 TaxID=2723090 RepID=UPI0016102CA4|nr:FecR domain-containing protein [Mucilaginibacter sp. FT3.2]MBB6233308.1 ferric-dicitrate binding protein FerR (iron transport regulator) [Mucilaginibacter sp. FT3.2]
MDKDKLELLAKKYFDGTATTEEKALLSQWYDTIHQNEGEEIYVNSTETADQIKQRIFNSIQQNLQPQQDTVIKPKYFVLKRLIQAASVAAVLAIGFFVIRPADKPAAPKVAQNQVVNVPTNRVLHITLPDGSRVWLKAGSVFRYPQNFTGKTRQVELVEGRAFFDIKHVVGQPFIVKTKNLDVNVLGTSFDVRSYKKEGETRVSVITGKVGITQPNSKNKKAIFLLPREEIVLSYASSLPIKDAVKGAAINAWCKNNTVFEQETLENVFKALEKEYNTTITIENKKLLDERISIVLGSQHLDSIIQVLSYTKHFKYQIANDSTVVIK